MVMENQANSILLVEEDREIGLSVKLQLELGGFAVEMDTDPVAALERFCASPSRYILVIMDVKMVRMSAFEFMRAVKGADPASRILMITPFEIRSSEFSTVIPSGKVNGFVQRPLLATRLVESVREVLAPPHQDNL